LSGSHVLRGELLRQSCFERRVVEAVIFCEESCWGSHVLRGELLRQSCFDRRVVEAVMF